MRPEIIFGLLLIIFLCIAGSCGFLTPKDGQIGQFGLEDGQQVQCIYYQGSCYASPELTSTKENSFSQKPRFLETTDPIYLNLVNQVEASRVTPTPIPDLKPIRTIKNSMGKEVYGVAEFVDSNGQNCTVVYELNAKVNFNHGESPSISCK